MWFFALQMAGKSWIGPAEEIKFEKIWIAYFSWTSTAPFTIGFSAPSTISQKAIPNWSLLSLACPYCPIPGYSLYSSTKSAFAAMGKNKFCQKNCKIVTLSISDRLRNTKNFFDPAGNNIPIA